MPSFSTSLSCHARIHDLVGHLVWRLQLLHEKVHLGSAHIDTVDVVNSLAGLLPPISFPTLVGSNVVQGWLVQAMEETLNDQPFFHAVVGGMLQCTPGISPKLSEWLHLGAVEIQRSCLGGHWFCPPGNTSSEMHWSKPLMW